MDSNLFILISCFTITYAGASDTESNNTFLPFLKNIDDHENYLVEEHVALTTLVATEDVIKFLNGSDSMSGFGKGWIVLPDGNGTAQVALIKSEQPSLNGPPKFPLKWPFFNDTAEAYEKVKFQLFSAEEPKGVNFKLEDLDALEFPKKDGVKIICHGWRSNGNSDLIQGLKNAYITEQNVSVIGVDWSYSANNIFYNLCAKKTSHVGKTIGNLINKLVRKFDLRFEDFHIIGHSLGAHIAGFAGRITESKIGRITGLDPALPGFQYFYIAGGRLDKADANYVDIIHSCASSLGMSVPVGHVDFYPNGGSPLQPGCSEVLADGLPLGLSTLACSHARSYEFFEESIKKRSNFIAVQCDGWNKFKSHNCTQEFTQMGDRVNKNSRGIYYLKTDDRIPYYLGIKGTIF